MKMEELKEIWEYGVSNTIDIKNETLMKDLSVELDRFERRIAKRDKLEIGVAIILIPLFLGAAFFVPMLLPKIAFFLFVPYLLLVIYQLKAVKKHKVVNNSVDVGESLRHQRLYYAKERDLLNSVLYWYILPPAVLQIVLYVTFVTSTGKLAFFIGLVVMVSVVIYILNKQAVKKDLDPMIRKLDDAILNYTSAEDSNTDE